jgi:hypothetical protein
VTVLKAAGGMIHGRLHSLLPWRCAQTIAAELMSGCTR